MDPPGEPMRIRELKQVAPVQASSVAAKQSPKAEDRVTLEKTRELKQAIDSAKLTAGSGRAAQLAALEASIANGTIKPNAQQIADRLLSAAEVDAQLRSLLQSP